MNFYTALAPVDRPILGSRVQFSAMLRRTHDGQHSGWVKDDLKRPVTGIYIGLRYKQNGRIVYDYEGGNEWAQESTTAAALIVVDEHKAPSVVPFESITIIV